MEWYKRKPKSYRADTWGLTLAEHGAYNLLIDHYYDTERPLPLQDQALASICGCPLDKWLEVKEVVMRYFRVTNAGYRHDTCDEVIDAALGSRGLDRQRQKTFRKRLKEKASVTHVSRVSHATREDKIREENPPLTVPPQGDAKPGNGHDKQDTSRGTRWPEDRKVPEDWRAKAIEVCEKKAWGVDVALEAVKFANHWASQPGARGRKSNWERTWINWIIKAAEQAPRRGRLL